MNTLIPLAYHYGGGVSAHMVVVVAAAPTME
jgi:hypothetical protein